MSLFHEFHSKSRGSIVSAFVVWPFIGILPQGGSLSKGTMMTTKSVPLSKISIWLRSQAQTWWTVDGDSRLDRKLMMPAREYELADAMDRYCSGDQLEVIVPDGNMAGDSEVEQLFAAGGDGYGRMLQALGGYDQDGWLLVEQTQFVNEANQEVEEFLQNEK